MGQPSQYYITLTFVVEEDGDQYASYCTELGTASCGDSHDEALRNIEEAVLLDVETLLETGQLDQFLKARGIPKRRLTADPARRRPVTRRLPRNVCTQVYDALIPALP